jgi:PAS domain S-box-containing protein
MDWKEKAYETAFIGTLTLIGSWFVRKYRPALKEVRRIVSVTEDISSLKKKLEITTATVDAILSVHENAVFLCKDNGDLTYANEVMCEMFGANVEDLEGEGWLRFIVDKHRDYVIKSYQSAIKNGRHFAPSFTIRNGETGVETKCDCSIIIRRNSEAAVISIFGVVKTNLSESTKK